MKPSAVTDRHLGKDPRNAGSSDPRAAELHERWRLIWQLERSMELPLLILSFLWLGLLVVELIRGISPLLEAFGIALWAIFILDFGIRFLLAPRKLSYLRRNWVTAVALLVPAFRIFRAFRALRILRLARTTRGLRLVTVLSSVNRGMRALRASLRRRGFSYILGLTLIVHILGSTGMYGFEKDVPDPAGLHDFGTSLWWTAMMLTTMGSQYWPQTPEGRVLALLLAIYAFAIFGYITAAIASFFVGRDASASTDEKREPPIHPQMEALKTEIQALRAEIQDLKISSREK